MLFKLYWCIQASFLPSYFQSSFNTSLFQTTTDNDTIKPTHLIHHCGRDVFENYADECGILHPKNYGKSSRHSLVYCQVGAHADIVQFYHSPYALDSIAHMQVPVHAVPHYVLQPSTLCPLRILALPRTLHVRAPFMRTAAYVRRPRGPLCLLTPTPSP